MMKEGAARRPGEKTVLSSKELTFILGGSYLRNCLGGDKIIFFPPYNTKFHPTDGGRGRNFERFS